MAHFVVSTALSVDQRQVAWNSGRDSVAWEAVPLGQENIGYYEPEQFGRRAVECRHRHTEGHEQEARVDSSAEDVVEPPVAVWETPEAPVVMYEAVAHETGLVAARTSQHCYWYEV
jgi:hypothetical protein